MSFTPQGGSAAANDYDYQSGSGMDSFLSRSIDEVSWQSSLGTSYNTLSELPIGAYPSQAVPVNYDLTQLSGTQSGASTIGGSGTGNSANSGGIQISSSNQQISLSDGATTRLIIGNDQGGF